jgi:hypothetical protein
MGEQDLLLFSKTLIRCETSDLQKTQGEPRVLRLSGSPLELSSGVKPLHWFEVRTHLSIPLTFHIWQNRQNGLW